MSIDFSSRCAASEAYLYGRINFERRTDDPPAGWDFRFETILNLLQRRDDPHLKYPVIHVAGTKGKGSVVSMIAAILSAAGYRTGVYYSPHLENIRERITVERELIPENDFCELVDSFRDDVESIDQLSRTRSELHPPTFFEVLTAAAFDYFARRNVDVAVVEVGMGGRLDSTNVCHPAMTVITNIGLDHQRLLGATRCLIAAEKAGIIKPGVPLICGVAASKSADVIAEVAQRHRAPAYWLGRDFRCSIPGRVCSKEELTAFHTWGTVGQNYEMLNTQTNLIGRHQAMNASLAVAVVQWLAHRDWRIDPAAIRFGLKNVLLPGRFQVFDGQPTVVLDIAHNELAVSAFVRTLTERYGSDPSARTLIFSASRDKKISRMLERLLPHFERIILTKIVGNPRGCELPVLQRLAAKLLADWSSPGRPAPKVESTPDSQRAWERVIQSDVSTRCVAVTGSAFLVGEMLPVIRTWQSSHPSCVEQ